MILPFPDFILDYILHYWRPGKKFLEIGCGTSYLRTHIKEDYIGVDITGDDYLEGHSRDVDIVCDGHNIPLEDESVDFIFIKSTLYMMNPERALKEFCRLLKPNGRLLVFDYNYRTQRKLSKRPNSGFTYTMWSQFGLYKAVKNAGFSDVQLMNDYYPSKFFLYKYINLIAQECRGDWANVTAVKRG